MTKVGVVIPVYNGERFLREALDSVFVQTFQDFEVICVDDGSTDGSLEIIRSYGSRVTVISQTNAGGCAARNAGVRRATAPDIAFLDQDDRWYPRKLEQQVRVLDAEPDVVLVLCNSDRMDAEGRMLQFGATLAERATLRDSPLGRLMETDQLLPSAILVRLDSFERAGGKRCRPVSGKIRSGLGPFPASSGRSCLLSRGRAETGVEHSVAVSVVIPLYNAAGVIGETISSALAQTWTDREILVIDDGSPDGSSHVVRSLCNQRRSYEFENAGFAA